MTYALWYSVVDLYPYLFGSYPKMSFVKRTERRALLYSAELLEDVLYGCFAVSKHYHRTKVAIFMKRSKPP